jgi:hypothetical protein
MVFLLLFGLFLIGAFLWGCLVVVYEDRLGNPLFFGVRAGEVIAHYYEPEYMKAGEYYPEIRSVERFIPASQGPPSLEPAVWALQLRDDRGKTGWLRFRHTRP